ncbi:MAG: NADP oxidoreductase [Candidatus Latescibacteria bacterium]|nr:NADP oxidoreductase [Candidatus Latescibacterota bacterium]
MSKLRMATVWMDGCSGCHMSFLDMDERLVALAAHVELVYSPLVDIKEYPDQVDLALIEGAVSSEEDLAKIKKIRQHTKILVSLGDCAITGNVPAMRNPFRLDAVLDRAYFENAATNQQVPVQVVPPLLDRVRPVHEVVKVDLFVPGCPPAADTIHFALTELLAGRIPELGDKTRFGA